MKILIIAPYYHPYINPRAHRWTNIAEEWAKKYEIHVICSKQKELPNSTTLNGVHIYRTGHNSAKELLANTLKTKQVRGQVATKSTAKKSSINLNYWLMQANEQIWKRIYFPDDSCIWYAPAKKLALKLLAQQKFDVIVSVALPFTAHLVGLVCKKRYPNLKWLADTGDPFSLQVEAPLNNHFLYNNWNKKKEREVLQLADAISVTTPATERLYEQHFEESKGKMTVIPPLSSYLEGGIAKDIPYFQNMEYLNLHSTISTIHMGYFGSFFKIVREPKPFLDFLRQLFQKYPSLKERLKVHFFGNIFENFQLEFNQYADLQNNFEMHGLIPREAIPSTMQKMDILLNISNLTTYQLPSKSVDYYLSEKPILNISCIENDTFSVFFKDYSKIKTVVKKEDENRSGEEWEAIFNFIENAPQNKERIANIDAKRKEFSKEEIAKKYFKLIS